MLLQLYKIGLFFYQYLVWLFSLFNPKAKLWINGRKLNIPVLAKSSKRVWFHCASLGEFEQAKPLIDKFLIEDGYTIVLTFFSPSGYEHKKNLPYEWVGYLPFDSNFENSHFVEKIKPTIAVFIRYELWYFTLKTLNQNKVPVFLVSASFRKNHFAFHSFFSPFYKHIFSFFTAIFVLDIFSQKSIQLLTKQPVFIAGDTRLDRVLEQKNTTFNDLVIERFLDKEKDCVIAGSSWIADYEVIRSIFEKSGKKLIIFPHHISNYEIDYVRKFFNNQVHLYSEGAFQKFEFNILIVNEIGKLAYSYRYASLAYVGGGFGISVHNILEPIVYEIPVICGPKIDKSIEANDLSKSNVCYIVKDIYDVEKSVKMIEENRDQISSNVKLYIANKSGGTKIIFEKIKELLN